MTHSSYPSVIEIIDVYVGLERDKSKMITDVFPRVRVIHPEWSGGSFYDALKILGETAAYDLAMKKQSELLQVLGIERYYDLEGHDNTVDVLNLTKKILLNQSSSVSTSSFTETTNIPIFCIKCGKELADSYWWATTEQGGAMEGPYCGICSNLRLSPTTAKEGNE